MSSEEREERNSYMYMILNIQQKVVKTLIFPAIMEDQTLVFVRKKLSFFNYKTMAQLTPSGQESLD